MSEADSSAIDEYVRRVVAEAPPLRPDQKSKLRTLLTGALNDADTNGTGSAPR